MSWREKLGIPEKDDRSDTSITSVTCVTSFVDTEKAESSCLTFDPEHPVVVRARTLLNKTGVRTMLLEGAIAIGVWSDLDGPEIRSALRTIGLERLPMRYIDGAGIPVQCKLRRVEGEPVPMQVLAEMERHPAEPWTVRDRMLMEMGWCWKRRDRGNRTGSGDEARRELDAAGSRHFGAVSRSEETRVFAV